MSDCLLRLVETENKGLELRPLPAPVTKATKLRSQVLELSTEFQNANVLAESLAEVQ